VSDKGSHTKGMMSDSPAERMISAALGETTAKPAKTLPPDDLPPLSPVNKQKGDTKIAGLKSVPSAKKEAPAKTAKPKKPKPHYHGHRDRLRARFKDGGASALADYELLELYLFNSIPQGDVKPVAKALIAQFGSFAEVCAAPVHRLTEVKGIGPKTALDLQIIKAAATKLGQESVLGRPILSSWTALLDYCRSAMQFEGVEQFRVLFLDRKNRLIADEVLGRGTVDRAPVYPREIMKRALDLEATALILCHNHPSGDPTPSQSDIDMTNHIISAAKPLSIAVHDHLIIGRENIASFKTLGLM